jgi:hypothetical protein
MSKDLNVDHLARDNRIAIIYGPKKRVNKVTGNLGLIR